MKVYVAVSRNHRSIVAVLADSEREARARIREQLNRPGRRAYAQLWEDGGEQVVERGKAKSEEQDS